MQEREDALGFRYVNQLDLFIPWIPPFNLAGAGQVAVEYSNRWEGRGTYLNCTSTYLLPLLVLTQLQGTASCQVVLPAVNSFVKLATALIPKELDAASLVSGSAFPA